MDFSNKKNYFKRKRDTQYHPYKDVKKSRVIPQKAMKNALMRSLEQKAYYTDGHVHANTTGDVASLFSPSSGTGTTGRVGSKASYKGLNISITATAVSAAKINWVLLYDKETRAAVPTLGNIWSTIGGMGPRAHQYKGRFIVLAKGDDYLDAAANNTGLHLRRWDKYIDLRGKICRFNTLDNGNVGDIDSGSLILATSGSVVSGANDTTLDYVATTTFVDA